MTNNSPVAVVTGAGGGLGSSHTRALVAEGFRVIANDVADPQALADEINSAAHDTVVVGVQSGVDTSAGAQAIVDATLSAFGRIDVVVNNAGILRDKSFAKMTPEMVTDVLNVHLVGAINVTHAAWPALKERGGSVIMTSSGSGLYGNFGQANYAAAKLGLVGLARTLAIEGQRSGIRVNAIAPLARSAMTEDVLPEDLLERLAPEWVSPLVAWLASESCGETGNIYSAAGGRYARVAIIEGPGITFDEIPTVAQLADQAAKLNNVTDGVEPRSLDDQVKLIPGR